eukprot:TRINITY_DN4740_c0_g1_i1.p1 TRINITY_DN4740_c0_g1~~TRINITY_DN4740_c0_g1_i1.p1  ORF type:complete len:279 (-),score=26.25 TRINITY_DN4740_c0_g1_i1:49-885(-)
MRACLLVFASHNHYVMDFDLSPVDKYSLVSGGLDQVNIVWKYSANRVAPVLELHSHKNGVNCVKYSPHSSDFVSGADDALVAFHTLTDTKNDTKKYVVKELVGHSHNVTSAVFHSLFPNILLTTAEDGTIRVWDLYNNKSVAYSVKYGRAWKIVSCPQNPNLFAIAHDSGTMMFYFKDFTNTSLKEIPFTIANTQRKDIPRTQTKFWKNSGFWCLMVGLMLICAGCAGVVKAAPKNMLEFPWFVFLILGIPFSFFLLSLIGFGIVTLLVKLWGKITRK